MPPNSTEMLSSRSPLEEKLSNVDRRENGIQEKPTSLVEVVKHLPEDVFEKRPFRAYMAAFQVRHNTRDPIEGEYDNCRAPKTECL